MITLHQHNIRYGFCAALGLLALLNAPLPRVQAEDGPPSIATGLGVTLADPSHASYLAQLGMDWARIVVSWKDAEPAPGQFDWGGADNIVNQVAPQAKLILQMPTLPPGRGPAPAIPP